MWWKQCGGPRVVEQFDLMEPVRDGPYTKDIPDRGKVGQVGRRRVICHRLFPMRVLVGRQQRVEVVHSAHSFRHQTLSRRMSAYRRHTQIDTRTDVRRSESGTH